jgi:hypothetical protein
VNHPISLIVANVGFLALLTIANLQGTVAIVASTIAAVFYLVELFEKPTVQNFIKKIRNSFG